MQIPVVLKVTMTPYQSHVYNWVKATGTLRLDPNGPLFGQRRHQFAPLNNKVMELRKVCNHPLLSYPHQEYTLESLVRQCGKLSVLDRVLIKLYKAGHRVLLFSTMTKLLDLVEVYMKWRRMDDGSAFNYRRIDGGVLSLYLEFDPTFCVFQEPPWRKEKLQLEISINRDRMFFYFC
mgnify:CR=1 FL=1